jgi:hypothetical protein
MFGSDREVANSVMAETAVVNAKEQIRFTTSGFRDLMLRTFESCIATEDALVD